MERIKIIIVRPGEEVSSEVKVKSTENYDVVVDYLDIGRKESFINFYIKDNKTADVMKRLLQGAYGESNNPRRDEALEKAMRKQPGWSRMIVLFKTIDREKLLRDLTRSEIEYVAI
ncbi:MAG: hypothetical protein UU65_C0004G0047 [candidate division CPR2 bacterium GW2011_GWC1_41_48]|uniref:Uncharacterized protein n=1 Tax=candidate division CPR2 bacterium GW2011_GWC1_41_48 TaxID=1618344 RepID=A0A0G0YH08_UNCC2|nr:MAG: hypothetical protein UT47_C0004G0072 [candidate division CPR2 bacterium GW2011_GWC2_39_35]KKR27150.1 MAG: hypothetical protein UT60_C0059G0006 [candidate division CPR2 bacterium GW2011_GWD2_39_7]KKR27705.1 MAG: hypothetical protein UT59_C0047G0006 [candidate division CPR2 bacterium GW2011_GWD1_39_7]KKS08836.1 MAG: hypothetical protein UU65_C0004G0047 [candidate division CPR2 bacterium GW2011_GWC1_41_48]